jgi:hypothetical protein
MLPVAAVPSRSSSWMAFADASCNAMRNHPV